MTVEQKMSRALGIMLISLALFVIALVVATFFLARAAMAQHVHPDETITDPRVAKFYNEWKRPPERTVSCCNREDCYDAQIRRGPKGLEYFHKWSGTWAAIPPSVLESNQPDPHDSPNTTNHVCANKHYPKIVYCAVLSSGL